MTIDEKYLEILRCPIDPNREATLAMDDMKVVCSRCRVQFRSRDGFLNLVVDEAILPEGCPQLDKLPCRGPQ
jgi:uncharacterized protein YbaR (Trm112 family)